MADKGKGLMIMIGGPKDSGPAKDSVGPGDTADTPDASNADMAKEQAAKALIRGVKNGDVQAVNDALEAHYEACSAGK
jgi:hypothetical protein